MMNRGESFRRIIWKITQDCFIFKAHLRFNSQSIHEALASVVTWHMVLGTVCFISY